MIKINELYHYGMPRRSGRYPWGSGERPFQNDTIKTIDGLVKQNKKALKETNSFLAAQEIGHQMKQKGNSSVNFQEAANRLSEKSKKIDHEVEDIRKTLSKEISEAAKNPEFRKEVNDLVYEDSTLDDAIREVINFSKYTQESNKKRLKLNEDIDDYEKSLINEVNNLVGGDLGSMKIPKTLSGVTYNDVLRVALNYDNTHLWNLHILEEMEEGVSDIILSYIYEYD